jgi:GNAT superfamily N-acetyltransferase
MAATEAEAGLAPLVEMGEAHVTAGLALSDEAGWDQTAEDWSLMIRLGRAFAAVSSEGRLVATALALPYPPAFGWLSMVLVHGPYRRRGLATRLLERSIAELRNRGLVPFLDATPAGRPVYERLGFRPIEALTRWRGQGGGPAASSLAPVSSRGLAEIAELDHAAFGADRSAVLADLHGRPGAVSRCGPAAEGFLLSRPGRRATHVGPVVARETETALGLLESGLASISGPVLIDVPDREAAVTGLLAGRGFRPERPYVRMALDRDGGFGDAALVRAVAGPELG